MSWTLRITRLKPLPQDAGGMIHTMKSVVYISKGLCPQVHFALRYHGVFFTANCSEAAQRKITIGCAVHSVITQRKMHKWTQAFMLISASTDNRTMVT